MSRPKCPNHHVTMTPTNERTIWICPISGFRFEVDVDSGDVQRRIKSDGSVEEVHKIIPLDGEGG